MVILSVCGIACGRFAPLRDRPASGRDRTFISTARRADGMEFSCRAVVGALRGDQRIVIGSSCAIERVRIEQEPIGAS